MCEGLSLWPFDIAPQILDTGSTTDHSLAMCGQGAISYPAATPPSIHSHSLQWTRGSIDQFHLDDHRLSITIAGRHALSTRAALYRSLAFPDPPECDPGMPALSYPLSTTATIQPGRPVLHARTAARPPHGGDGRANAQGLGRAGLRYGPGLPRAGCCRCIGAIHPRVRISTPVDHYHPELSS